ncbi:MAG TPA: HEPN domain-containing protein [Ktedonobacterales bacterium]|jgi:HEPN domain-containing protein|nr:HEPN domain-containing protein [Ktedonobacterales bacterium]
MSVDEALGIYAEAAQDLSSAGLALAAGNLYNCADLCNQVAEKILQAVYVLAHDSRAPYNHNLHTLGALVGAPPEILGDLDVLNLYHPGAFLAHRTVEQADDEVGGDTASDLIQRTRRVLRWARPMVLG